MTRILTVARGRERHSSNTFSYFFIVVHTISILPIIRAQILFRVSSHVRKSFDSFLTTARSLQRGLVYSAFVQSATAGSVLVCVYSSVSRVTFSI